MDEGDPTTYTAGLIGFVILFALAVVCWLLFRSMNKHLRGVRYREEMQEAQKVLHNGQSANPDDSSPSDQDTPGS